MTTKARFNPERHHRQSVRRPGWAYGGPGRYFVTVCSFDRETIFGEVVDGIVSLSEIGVIAEQTWLEIAVVNPHITLDAHIVMPNHLHGIVVVSTDDFAHRSAERPGRPRGAAGGSLGAMIGRFKSTATRRVNDLPNVGTSTLWQRGYHDRIIPDDDALDRAGLHPQQPNQLAPRSRPPTPCPPPIQSIAPMNQCPQSGSAIV